MTTYSAEYAPSLFGASEDLTFALDPISFDSTTDFTVRVHGLLTPLAPESFDSTTDFSAQLRGFLVDLEPDPFNSTSDFDASAKTIVGIEFDQADASFNSTSDFDAYLTVEAPLSLPPGGYIDIDGNWLCDPIIGWVAEE